MKPTGALLPVRGERTPRRRAQVAQLLCTAREAEAADCALHDRQEPDDNGSIISVLIFARR
eukprot:6298599-Prymnesium_polylepis.1